MLSLIERIVVHVCYRDIFNAPTRISDLARWVGEDENSCEFQESINELSHKKLIQSKKGYLTVNGKSSIVEMQPEKIELTKKLIEKGNPTLKLLGKLGIVRFIGISGSIAANNPTVNTHFMGVGHVDLDLFMITSRNTLWIFLLFERLYTNLLKIVTGKHFYCFNYVTDDSFLEIHNKNFFTATELINLKQVLDKKVFDHFIQDNQWYTSYYPDYFNHEEQQTNQETSFFQKLLWLPNYLCFFFFVLARTVRRLDLGCLKELSSRFNPEVKCNLKRLSNPRGGYQHNIKDRFEVLFKQNFTSYYNRNIMEFLFPRVSLYGKDADNIYDYEHNQLFRKYNVEKVNAESII